MTIDRVKHHSLELRIPCLSRFGRPRIPLAVVRLITRALSAGAPGMWAACAFALFLAAQFASAQELAAPVHGYVHRMWTTRQGLPQNIVRALMQTRDGYLWIGTGSGLARFDGVTFTLFEITNTPELGANYITSLFEDRAGTLWIGTARGLAWVDSETGRVSREPAPLAEAPIHSLVEDRAGRLWIGSVNTLFLRTRTV
jgi:ligand-binding sensor domain-containing protein